MKCLDWYQSIKNSMIIKQKCIILLCHNIFKECLILDKGQVIKTSFGRFIAVVYLVIKSLKQGGCMNARL